MIETGDEEKERTTYDSSKEEYNSDCKAVGPCRNDFGHIGPDKANLRFEYYSGEDGKEGDTVGIREDFMKYERPPFLYLRLHSKNFTLRH